MIIDGVKKRRSGTITINYTEGGKQYGLTLTPQEIVENYKARPTKRAVDDATRRDFERDHLHPYGYDSLCGLCNPHRN